MTNHHATPGDNDPYLMIAADAHAGLPTEQYREYLEKKFYPEFDDFLSERSAAIEASTKLGVRNDEYAKKWYEDHGDELPVAGTPSNGISQWTSTV